MCILRHKSDKNASSGKRLLGPMTFLQDLVVQMPDSALEVIDSTHLGDRSEAWPSIWSSVTPGLLLVSVHAFNSAFPLQCKLLLSLFSEH